MFIENQIQAWMHCLLLATAQTVVTVGRETQSLVPLGRGVEGLMSTRAARRVILFGNGGSLAIAAHIATDWSLSGWSALALTDSVALTSHGNDFGGDANFSKQLELMRLSADDLCIALSCSGRSPNILEAVKVAHAVGATAYTFSGFDADNPLRTLGDVNFYVPSPDYGIVQLAHEAILHMTSDFSDGWTPAV